MSILTVFLYALVVVLALLLIGIVLIQPAKSGGMGAAFGGIGESVFGAKAGSHLTKATVIMTTLFFALALALAVIIGRGWYKNKGGVGAKLEEETNTAAASNASATPAQPKKTVAPAQPKKVAAPAQPKKAVTPAQPKKAVTPAQPKKVAVPAQQKKAATPATEKKNPTAK